MAKFTFTSPEGKQYTVSGPDGATKEQAFQILQSQLAGGVNAASNVPKDSSLGNDIKQGIGNLVAGAIRGAGSIGSTILAPYDMAKDALDGKGLSLESNRQRRADIDAGLQTMGAQPDSFLYKAGKLGGEVAGTAGVGGALANGARVIAPSVASNPLAAKLLESVATSGFRTGVPAATTIAGKAADLGIRTVGGAITGGATAGMVDPKDTGIGTAVGGVLPVAATVVGKTLQAVGNKLRGGAVAPEVKALAQRAADLGIDVPADRVANSKPLNALASSLNYVPLSGRAATEEAMQNQLNRALSRTFGQDSDNVTMALRKASEDLGSEFDRVLQANTVKIDPQFAQDLADHTQRIMTELPFNTNPHSHIPASGNVLKKQIDMILEKGSSGEIDGQTAYNLKRTLDRMGKQNTPEAYYAREIKDSLMEALNRSLGANEAANFATTRQQYGNMRTLEKLAQNGAEGDISIGRLANLKNIKNPQLQELADIAAQFLKAREGQHGSMQRVAAGTAGAIGGLFGGALPAVIGGIAAGRGANALLNSGIARNAVMGDASPAVENALNKLLPLTYRTAPVFSAQ